MNSSFSSNCNVLSKELLYGDLVLIEQRNEASNNVEAEVLGKSEGFKSLDYCKIDGRMDRLTGVTISDVHRVSRKAEESANRRFQAASWLQNIVGYLDISDEPSEEELRLFLRNGLILCNLMNRIHPGAIPKIVENPLALSPRDGAHFVYQYFENVRNFLVAVEELKLPSFEASDLEQSSLVAGSMKKVVDCILALKSYFEWKESGAMGLWKYRSTSKYGPKASPKVFVGLSSNVKHQSEKSWNFPDLYSSINSDTSDCDCKLECKGDDLNDDMSTRNDKTQIKEINQSSIHSENCGLSLSDSNSTWIHQTGQKFLEALQKADSHSFPNLVRTLLDGRRFEELPVLVEFILKNATDEFEHRLILQGEQLKKLRIASKELLRREDKLVSRSKALEALAMGSGEEMKLNTAHLQLVKNIRAILDAIRQDVLNMKLGRQEEMEALQSKLERLTGAAAGYYQMQAENRALYNEVEELKGKIRVYCRVRPFQSATQGIVDFIGENGDILIRNPFKQERDGQKLFNFNKVYPASASQEEIFLNSRQLIRSVLDGFNVCIFAYGQTGSGKTYTMTGPCNTSKEDWGINYRSLKDLFQTSYSRKDVIHYEVGVQMIEIYNEHIRDLLVTDGTKKNLEIRNNSQHNGLHVPDANLVTVKSTEDVLELIKVGQKNRTVSATALNEHSSRSHSVLTVHIQGTDLVSRSILRSCLHLVDLAGSERVDKSEATGERLKEAQHINKSLSSLGDVIAALAQKRAHIPYRNSKLTQLLQDSLGGQARTIMFVHISQDSESYGETLSTLKFGERVASVELGAACSNKESWEVRELREQIASLLEALVKKDLEIGKRDAEIERLQTLKVMRTSGTSHSLTLGKQSLKDSNLSTSQRISTSEANTPRNAKHPLEMMAQDEAQEAVSNSTRQTQKRSLFLGTTCHDASEAGFEENNKTEDKLGLPRVVHKRSVSIDSQSSIASTTCNNFAQRTVQRKFILNREVGLKDWKHRVRTSSNAKGDDDFQIWDDNDVPNIDIHYNAPNLANSSQTQTTPVYLRSKSASGYSYRRVKLSSQQVCTLQLQGHSQRKYSVTHESYDMTKVNDSNVSIEGLQSSCQMWDVRGDLDDKSSELSGLSQETDTDVSLMTSCEQLVPCMSDNRMSKGAEMRSSHRTKIPRPPFRNILKLSNDGQHMIPH
ncbi:hypothetical protein O6H91_22G014400 [Diphasiastrum complanatum]|uniref:Uncharacterized protein n=2 Tax=Diphasiastrum complanatum TaxID=34168 RepID=A0ACC2AD63_DIPCM|nr:hypothetical protein O6H91_22G014400 [Diphasiastrum complanatum]KAJ7515472.1 hypothetical protein O6H91_22G014400 [Diphasiastrum complanatum]